MREIKFRYWNSITNQMVTNPEMPYKKGWTIDDLFSDRGWVWQQFIGLKDKNDKEIAVGDLVKVTAPNSTLESERNGVVLEVRDLLNMWRDGEDWLVQAPKCCMEVIGNIYENPNLLTKKGIKPMTQVSKEEQLLKIFDMYLPGEIDRLKICPNFSPLITEILNFIKPEETTWYRQDTYVVTIPVKRNLKSILRILLRGKLDLSWTIPSNEKDKRLILEGKLKEN